MWRGSSFNRYSFNFRSASAYQNEASGALEVKACHLDYLENVWKPQTLDAMSKKLQTELPDKWPTTGTKSCQKL